MFRVTMTPSPSCLLTAIISILILFHSKSPVDSTFTFNHPALLLPIQDMSSSIPPSNNTRGVRFGMPPNSENVLDLDLMDAASRDQARLRHQPSFAGRRIMSDASPFSATYSVSATARPNDYLHRSHSSRSDNIGPLDSASNYSAPDSDTEEGRQETRQDGFGEHAPYSSRSVSTLRPAGRSIDPGEGEEEDAPASASEAIAFGLSKARHGTVDPRCFSQPQTSTAAASRVSLPSRPQPAVTSTPLRGLGMGLPSSSAASGRDNSAFPSPLRQHVSSSRGKRDPSTSYVQHYDPTTPSANVLPFSPRVPFSPQVTASGALRPLILKPALCRRGRSIEDFEVNDAGDSLERGTVRKSEALEGRSASTSIVGTMAHLFQAARSSDDTIPGYSSTHRGSGDTLIGDVFAKVKDDNDSNDDRDQYLARRPLNRRHLSDYEDGLLDDDDPALTGAHRKSMEAKRAMQFSHRRSSWSSETGDPTMPTISQRRRASTDATSINSDDARMEKYSRARTNFGRRKTASTIQVHVENVMQRQKFILKLAKALMFFGAPSHRIESQLNATASVLEVDAQFVHFPGLVIASFGDLDKRTSETHFVKSSSSLSLGLLHEVHRVYRKVMHDDIGVAEGIKELDAMLKARPCYAIWQRVLLAAASCFIIAPLSFGGSLVDACIAALYGAGLVFLRLHAARKNDMYSNVFEITSAILISFISRALSTTNFFCYQSIASSGVILVLPGYVILCGSLELASKNMIAGSVRMVYAIIYSLFLGFGIAIGSDLYFMFDPKAREALWVPLDDSTTVSGSFTFANATVPEWTGAFTFTNGVSNSLNKGSIICEREPEWPWYRQAMSPWLTFAFVPIFSLLSCMNNLQPLKSRHLPVMVVIACIGYAANYTAKMYIFNRSDIVSAIGSFVIGILGNAYSRIFRGTAFTVMAVAVLFLVPSGMAMAGGLAMTYKGSDGDLYSNGLSIGLRMVQVAIGITVGLFGSGLVVYSFGRRKGAALFAF